MRWIAVSVLAVSLSGCCGPCSYLGRPGPTSENVTMSDIAGSWKYYTTGGKPGEVVLFGDGTFMQIVTNPVSGESVASEGSWELRGPELIMRGFVFTSRRSGRGIEYPGTVHFYVTTWLGSDPVPFGGEWDADHWGRWTRIERDREAAE